jgi:SagB-type dehydrogenase family enzyme
MPYRTISLLSLAVLLAGCGDTTGGSCDASVGAADAGDPGPGLTGESELHLREVMNARRSTDYYAPYGTDPITLEDLQALAWAAQGITLPDSPTGWPDVFGLRTTPSAGATYPIELYVVAEKVEGLEPGAYRYVPFDDSFEPTGATGPLAEAFAQIRIDESPSSEPKVFSEAAAIFVITSVHQRTSNKYGDWAELYIGLEAGHVAQNILLMATARGLAHRPWGALSQGGRQAVVDLLAIGEDVLLPDATAPSCHQPLSTNNWHWPLYFLGIGQQP